MTREWRDPQPVAVPRSLREAVGGHPLVAETLVRRGISTVADARAFLDPALYRPAAAEELPGIPEAAARILRAIADGERICVWGDFDVDGQTATTVLVSVLRDLGADVIHHIPVRETESHGIKVPWLARELDKGVKLVVTCDTGIDAHEAVDYAQAAGVDVVITDHHELPEQVPGGYAVVNPHLLPDGHPLGTLPGVGVAYKLAEALYRLVDRGERAELLLDLVALGIVADVAEQTGDTRYLLQLGLRELRQTSRLGLQELAKQAGIDLSGIDEQDIGFAIGPRLNALGRLSDANPIVDFLTTDDLSVARIMASELESLNARRRLLCDQVDGAAEAHLARDPSLLKRSALVLSDPEWPAGVIGIVANRLVERYDRPVVLIASPPGDLAHGSARSVEGCHITQAIASQSRLLQGFGGHEMAAGLTIDPERIHDFAEGLDRAVAEQLAEREAARGRLIHGYVALDELTLALVADLERLAPFGAGNPPLVLATRDVEISGLRKLGRAGRHLRLTVTDRHETRRDVVWWRWDGAELPDGRFDLAFGLRSNEYRGALSVQLVWQEARPTVEAGRASPVAQPQSIVVEDWRGAVDAESRLVSLLKSQPGVVVWAEGKVPIEISPQGRHALQPSQTLVVWSCPPGVESLQLALRRVTPSAVILVGRVTALDEPRAFLAYLAGLVKHALSRREGRTSVPELAAAMGQRESAVRAGLAWLEAKGIVHTVSGGGMQLHLEAGGTEVAPVAERKVADLMRVLAETSAYRRFFARADSEHVIKAILPMTEKDAPRASDFASGG